MVGLVGQKGQVPKLRFPEFSGKWEIKSLSEVTVWASGGTPDKSNPDYWEGDIPWISASSMHNSSIWTSPYQITEEALRVGSKIAKKGSILVLTRGSMLFNRIPVSLAMRDVAFNQDIKSLAVLDGLENEFLLYWFQSKEERIKSLVTGTGIGAGKLDTGTLQKLSFAFPLKNEQKKIQEFLGLIDTWIENLRQQKESLVRYKKSVMQKIFSQELRFKDMDGKSFPEWKEVKLQDCVDYEQPTAYIVKSTEYENGYSTPVLTAGKTFILGYTDETFGIYNGLLPVIIFDDFTTASQLVNFRFKVKSSALKILRAKKSVDTVFVFAAMQCIKFNVGGHGRQWISKYSQIKIPLPTLAEQKKIAALLLEINELINANGNKIRAAKRWKMGLLQGLFL